MLRFWNNDVFDDLESIVDAILLELERRILIPQRPPAPHASPSDPPSPLGGGGYGDGATAPRSPRAFVFPERGGAQTYGVLLTTARPVKESTSFCKMLPLSGLVDGLV